MSIYENPKYHKLSQRLYLNPRETSHSRFPLILRPGFETVSSVETLLWRSHSHLGCVLLWCRLASLQGTWHWVTFKDGDISRKAKHPALTWHFLVWCHFEILPELRSASNLKCYHGYRTSGSWSGFFWFRLHVLSSHVFGQIAMSRLPRPSSNIPGQFSPEALLWCRKPVGIELDVHTSFPATVIIIIISSLYLCWPDHRYSNFFKTWKKNATKAKKGKNKKQISKIQKTQKQNKKGKKGKTKERQKGKKNGFVHLHFFCVYFAFLICFFAFIVFFGFLPGKKQNKSKKKQKTKKSKSKKRNKCKQNAHGQIHILFPLFFPFWRSFFSPFILLRFFFSFEVLLFDFPCVFHFFAFFQV